MATEKTYGKWIKWDGGECPVPPDTRVEVKCRSGKVLKPRHAYRYRWKHIDSNADIVSYHTVTEPPDLDAADKLLRNNRYTVIPPAKSLTFDDLTPMTEAPPTDTEYWVVHSFSKTGAEPYRWGGNDLDQPTLQVEEY